jgi:hypothetical protein
MLIAAAKVVVDLHCISLAAMEIDLAVTSDHRDPRAERRLVA